MQGSIAGRRNALILAIAALTVLALGAPAAALSPGDEQCLSCHKTQGLEKPLQNGESLSLQISGDTFGKSVHSMFGCSACHSDIDPAKHPGSPMPIASRRDFSIMRAKVCTTCHTDQAAQWNHGVHAALVREGNPLAPVCTSCHAPHAVIKGAAQSMNTVPCKTCHGDIFAAYSTSVHGALRSAGITQAPLCFTCHGAHDTNIPTASPGMKGVCLGCHKDALVKHQEWLPNTQLHFEVINCPVCHAPKAHRKVDLILFNNVTSKDAARPVGVPEFDHLENVSASSPSGVDPVMLFKLMQALNKGGSTDHMSVKGRLDVQTGQEAHRLTVAEQAIRDCKTCHQAGASAFQSVTVSVAGPAGIPQHYDVNKDVLKSVFSLNSIGGFYAIGGTRITLFDVLLVLSLLAGFGVPIVHIGVRWLAHRPEDVKKRDSGEK
jgi:hypothetical protein